MMACTSTSIASNTPAALLPKNCKPRRKARCPAHPSMRPQQHQITAGQYNAPAAPAPAAAPARPPPRPFPGRRCAPAGPPAPPAARRTAGRPPRSRTRRRPCASEARRFVRPASQLTYNMCALIVSRHVAYERASCWQVARFNAGAHSRVQLLASKAYRSNNRLPVQSSLMKKEKCLRPSAPAAAAQQRSLPLRVAQAHGQLALVAQHALVLLLQVLVAGLQLRVAPLLAAGGIWGACGKGA